MTVQKFIKYVYVEEIADIKDKHPYIAYMVMGAGIEFLGKVLEQPHRNDLFEKGHSKADFEKAISELSGLKRYKGIKNLYEQLRCALLHSSLPGVDIKLGNNKATENISTIPYVLNIDNFYNAFKDVCEDVVKQVDAGTVPITEEFLYVEKIIVPNQQPQSNEVMDNCSVALQDASSITTSLSGCPPRQQT